MFQNGPLFQIRHVTTNATPLTVVGQTFQAYDNGLLELTLQAKTTDGETIWWKKEIISVQCDDAVGYVLGSATVVHEYKDPVAWTYSYAFNGFDLEFTFTGAATEIEWIVSCSGAYSTIANPTPAAEEPIDFGGEP